MKAARLLLLLSLSGGWLASGSGCVTYFTESVRDAGLRHESTTSAGQHGPVLETWVRRDRGQMSVKYRVLANAEPQDRWLNVTTEDFVKAMRRDRAALGRAGKFCVLTLPEGRARRLVSKRPRWDLSEMHRFVPHLIEDPTDVREGGEFIGVLLPGGPPGGRAAHARVYLVLDLSETSDPDVLAFAFPDRTYRTAGGKAAQLLLPVAVTMDVASTAVAVAALLTVMTEWPLWVFP